MSQSIDNDVWGTDVPISMPVPPETGVLVKMGTFGFTNFGIAHDITNADLEDYLPTFIPPRRDNG